MICYANLHVARIVHHSITRTLRITPMTILHMLRGTFATVLVGKGDCVFALAQIGCTDSPIVVCVPDTFPTFVEASILCHDLPFESVAMKTGESLIWKT